MKYFRFQLFLGIFFQCTLSLVFMWLFWYIFLIIRSKINKKIFTKHKVYIQWNIFLCVKKRCKNIIYIHTHTYSGFVFGNARKTVKFVIRTRTKITSPDKECLVNSRTFWKIFFNFYDVIFDYHIWMFFFYLKKLKFFYDILKII